jgi:hypothetical protein
MERLRGMVKRMARETEKETEKARAREMEMGSALRKHAHWVQPLVKV